MPEDEISDDYYSNNDNNFDSDSSCENIKPKKENKGNCTEIKEQIYQDKLAIFKDQYSQLQAQTHPDYVRMLAEIDQKCIERREKNQFNYDYNKNVIEATYLQSVKNAKDNFAKKKKDLHENLIIELEEKLKQIEYEQPLIEIGSDNIDSKITTRKLRRRANEPIPVPDKRRKAFTNQICYTIDEEFILEDLRIINKISGKPYSRKQLSCSSAVGVNGSNNGSTCTAAQLTGAVGGASSGGMAISMGGVLPGGSSPRGGAGLHTGYPTTMGAAAGLSSPSCQHNLVTFGPSIIQDHRFQVETLYEAKIDDGRLLYDRKWYHKGQSVYVESKEHNKVAAVISAVGTQEVWLRKLEDGDRLRIFIMQLQNGRYTIRRRQP